MKSILYSALVAGVALALATGGAQAAKDNNRRSQRATPQQRSATVHAAARPATAARPASAMPATARAHRNPAAAGQAAAARAKAARPASTTAATIRQRNLARHERIGQRNAAKKTPEN